MFLNKHLLENCEEFFDFVSNVEENDELDFAIDSLRHFLEKDVDGFTSHSEEKLALAVQSRLSEIWNLISQTEKDENPMLEDFLSSFMQELEEASGYEADEIA